VAVRSHAPFLMMILSCWHGAYGVVVSRLSPLYHLFVGPLVDQVTKIYAWLFAILAVSLSAMVVLSLSGVFAGMVGHALLAVKAVVFTVECSVLRVI